VLSAARALLADTRPLQESPDYRRLWLGAALSSVGSQMTSVAVPVQIYTLTHSSLAVGLIGVPLAVPLLTLGLLGGSFADAGDRRRLVLLTSSLLAVVSLAFAAQAVLDLRRVWLLYVLIAVQSSLSAVDQPARRTIVRRLLPDERIRAASALTFLSFQVSVIVGPLLAGLLIATVSFGAVYLVDALSFVVALYAVLRLPPMPADEGTDRPGLRAIVEGLRFVRRHAVLGSLLLADLNATIFGFPRALFPAIAAAQFGGLRSVGLLYAALAMGGVVSAVFSGSLERVHRQGLALLVSIGVWGAAIAGFGLARSFPLAVALLALAGAADVVNGVFRTTILQVVTPDALQGRVNSVGFVVGVGGPDLGDVEAGAVAALTSPAISAVAGGLACVVGVVAIGLAAPGLVRYRPAVQTKGE
jgi:MFS family permease